MTKTASKKTHRHNGILDALKLNPSVRVNALARDLGVSAETVRRDLAELDETGRIKRTYGGAMHTNTFEPALTERLKLHIEERQRIARHAFSLIEDVEHLYIGGGATTLHFAHALRLIDRKITVLTATFSIATELATNPLIEVLSLPGIVEPKEGLVCGPETVEYMGRYKVPLSVMGASAIDEKGVSEALLSAAQVYSAMAAQTDRSLILADSSKFGHTSLQSIIQWSPATTIITETEPNKDLQNRIESQGATIQIAHN